MSTLYLFTFNDGVTLDMLFFFTVPNDPKCECDVVVLVTVHEVDLVLLLFLSFPLFFFILINSLVLLQSFQDFVVLYGRFIDTVR